MDNIIGGGGSAQRQLFAQGGDLRRTQAVTQGDGELLPPASSTAPLSLADALSSLDAEMRSLHSDIDRVATKLASVSEG